MMRLNNIKMTTVVSREELLQKLRANLQQYSQIIQEAIQGYIERAKGEVGKRLDALRSGKVVALQFNLNPPTDHSEVYKTVIQMLEWSREDTVTLSADEFRQLVQDEWDWTDSFLLANSLYSHSAQQQAISKQLM